jgi:flagellar basal body-associated protein FliL
MADNANKPASAEASEFGPPEQGQAGQSAPKKSKISKKILLIVGVVMLVEAAVVGVLFSMMGGPTHAEAGLQEISEEEASAAGGEGHAQPAEGAGESEGHGEGGGEGEHAVLENPNERVEVPLIAGRYPNSKRGRTYIYDTEVYLVTLAKDQSMLESMIKKMTAQISSDIRTIISRSEPNQLLEPSLGGVKRQIKAAMDERLGYDAEGHSRVLEVVVTRFTQFRAE